MAQQLDKAIELIDACNQEDPNLETSDGKEWPKELLYSHRMSDMLERYDAEADDAAKIFVRAQHIQRWMSPRSEYPMDRKGYFQWRRALYVYHAETTVGLLEQVGYDNAVVERVKTAISKIAIKTNADTQLLEDVIALVFIEHYMQAFVDKHPDYDEEKWMDIIRKTWNKMSERAQQFALGGNITLPEPLIPIIQKSIA